MTRSLQIEDVAAVSGFSANTLRSYEQIGLLPPSERSASGYRIYDQRTVDRLAFISRSKRLGCTPEEIRDLTTAKPAWCRIVEVLNDDWRRHARRCGELGIRRRDVPTDRDRRPHEWHGPRRLRVPRRIGIVLSPGGASQMADGAASTAEFRIVDPPEDGPRIATRVDGFWGVNVIAHGFESDEELLGMLASLVVVDPARFDDAVAGMPTTVPVDSTTPDGSVVSPQCTVPEGSDGSASPRATLEARVAGEFPGDAVTVLSDMSTRS